MFNRLMGMSMERRAREILRELEETKERLLSELTTVDKDTLSKLRNLVGDYYNAENRLTQMLTDVNIKATEEFADFRISIEKIRHDFEEEIKLYCGSDEIKELLMDSVSLIAPSVVDAHLGDIESAMNTIINLQEILLGNRDESDLGGEDSGGEGNTPDGDGTGDDGDGTGDDGTGDDGEGNTPDGDGDIENGSGNMIDPDELLYEFVGETEHGSHTESYNYNWDEDDNRTSVNFSYSHDGAGVVTDQPFGFVITSTENHAFGNEYRKLRVVIESYECPTPTPSINGKFFRDYSVGDSFVVEGVYREDDEFSYYDYFIDLYNVAHAATHFYCTLRFETVDE